VAPEVFCGIRIREPGSGFFGARFPAPIAGLLDNRVVSGQIGSIGCCGKAGLVGRDASRERKKWNCAL
jgi:hypothetical protein